MKRIYKILLGIMVIIAFGLGALLYINYNSRPTEFCLMNEDLRMAICPDRESGKFAKGTKYLQYSCYDGQRIVLQKPVHPDDRLDLEKVLIWGKRNGFDIIKMCEYGFFVKQAGKPL